MVLDYRFEALKKWLAGILNANYEIRPASVDASFRRYFRVTMHDRTHIVMDAPPEKEDIRPYLEIAARLHALGLNVPEILQYDLQQGFVLISDLGKRLYLRHLNEITADRMYEDALRALVTLQAGIFQDSAFLPEYDRVLLRREMELFREWYLSKHLGLNLTEKQHAVLDDIFDGLARSALAQPQVWVHRDYHSRNLMLTELNNPGILDFQDAVRGPITYDLVSLLRDCYIDWPQNRIEDWIEQYRTLAMRCGLPVGEDAGLFLQWFDRMGVQRHLKAIGIFARLNHRDGKAGYLNDIPRTLSYVLNVSRRRADLLPLFTLLRQLKIPEAMI